MIDIELWGGPVDGQIISVSALRRVWHVPMVPTGAAFDDDLMSLADALDVTQFQTAVYERELASTFGAMVREPQRYLYRGMLAG